MKNLGLSPQERAQRDQARRERNVFYALIVIALASAVTLSWLEPAIR